MTAPQTTNRTRTTLSTDRPIVEAAACRDGTAVQLLRSRRLVRAPIRLYRAGLGALFGSRLLMLEHRGRISGTRRFVVLEVSGRGSTPTH